MNERPNQSMKPTAPDQVNASILTNNNFPWLISFSLDLRCDLTRIGALKVRISV